MANKTKDAVVEKKEDKKSSRQQISKLIGINLSVSRVRKHVDKNNVNSDIEDACAELKSLLVQEKDGKKPDYATTTESTQALVKKAYETIYDTRKAKYDTLKTKLSKSKAAADVKKLKELNVFAEKTESLSEKIEYVSKLRCRFSNDASVVLASALDYVVQTLVSNAMVYAHSVGKAIIQVQHTLTDDIKGIDVWPLINRLDAIQKALNITDTDTGNTDDDKANDDDDSDDSKTDLADQDDDKHDSTFEFYINLICKNVKANLVNDDEKYTSIRVSKNIRKFCSDIVIQLIDRISPLIKLYAATAKVKTVNDEVVKHIFKFLLVDAGANSDKFCSFMDERLKIYYTIKDTDNKSKVK